MDDIKKIIAENSTHIQNIITANQEAIKNTVASNLFAVEKMIADNQMALDRNNAGIVNSSQPVTPVAGNKQERVDEALNEAQARLDQAVLDNRRAGSKTQTEIQQISERSLRNAQNRLVMAVEDGQKMFNKGLLEVREQAEKGITESATLLEQVLTGRRPDGSLSNLSPRWLSTSVLSTTSYPLGLRQNASRSQSNVLGSVMMGKIGRQIEDIEKIRQNEFSSILNELEQKLADLQNGLTRKGTIYQDGLSKKFDQTINQLGQDIRTQNNNLAQSLKKVDVRNPQAAAELCNQAQKQILNLQSNAIQALSHLFEELNTNNEIYMATLLQEADLLRSAAVSAVERVTAETENNLLKINLK